VGEIVFFLAILIPIAIYSIFYSSYWLTAITGSIRITIVDAVILIAVVLFGGTLLQKALLPSFIHVKIETLPLVFLFALIEEVGFRGFILFELLRRCSPAVAIGIQAALFTVFHLPRFVFYYDHPPPRLFFYFLIVGVVWGVVAYRTRSIWPATMGHLENFFITFVT